MLKYIPILLFILSPFSLSYGQKAANLMKNYVPSPEAYALMQYEAIPVSKHTGVPSVNILHLQFFSCQKDECVWYYMP